MSGFVARAAAAAFAVLLLGCAPRRAPRHAHQAPARDTHRDDVCAAPVGPVAPSFRVVPTAELPEGDRVVDVVVRGARSVPAQMILAVMTTRPGVIFDGVVADADVLRIEALSAFEDVRLGWERSGGGVKLTVEVDERPFLGAVYLAPGAPELTPGLWLPPLAGDLYEPAAVERALGTLMRSWMASGYLDARAQAHAVRVDAERVDLCLDLDPGPAWVVDRIDPVGATTVSAEELRARMDTRDGAYNVPGKPYRPDLLRDDALRMSGLLYDRGLLTSNVGAPRVTRIRERSAVRVEIPVSEGKVYRIGRITFAGRLAGPRKGYAALVKQSPGEVFTRSRWIESLEKLREHHRALTGKAAQVEPETVLHEDQGTVDVALQVKGG